MTEAPGVQAEPGPDDRVAGSAPSPSWPFVLLGLALLGVGLSFWRPIPAGVWHDDGVYVLIGKALAGGAGLHYQGVVGSPPAVKFPPAYPALLAVLWLVLRTLGRVTLAAGVLNLVFVATGGGLFAWALHRGAHMRRSVAVGVAAIAFVSADIWRYALVPLSEPLFILLSAAALAAWTFAERPADRRGSVVLAAMLVAAVLTRSAGWALIGGFAVALAWRRGPMVAVAVCAPAAAVALGWGAWAAERALAVPEGVRDVLGPYGGWLGGQLVSAPTAFAAALPAHVRAVVERVFTLLVPGATGWVLWLAAIPLTALAAVGVVRLTRTLVPVPWVASAYLAMLLLWPFVDRRLNAPLHPWMVALVCAGALELGARWSVARARWILGAAVFAWVGAYAVVSAERDAGGWAVAGYRLRAGRLAAAVETLQRTAPPDAVVGAPEFWAGLYLHGGWEVVPSARFTPTSEDSRPGVGEPGGATLPVVERRSRLPAPRAGWTGARRRAERPGVRCPGAVHILARMPPQMLVRLSWDRACARSLGLVR